MTIRGTDFFLIKVSDIGRSRQFYQEVLGLKEGQNWEGMWIEHEAGNSTVVIYHDTTSQEPFVTGANGCVVYWAVANLVEYVKQLKSKGVKVLQDALETPVCWMARIADPDGNEIGLHERKDGTFG